MDTLVGMRHLEDLAEAQHSTLSPEGAQTPSRNSRNLDQVRDPHLAARLVPVRPASHAVRCLQVHHLVGKTVPYMIYRVSIRW